MRLLICAGGTGGGVYPALTVTQELDKNQHQVLWVGSEGGMEADLVARAGLEFKAILAAGVHGVSLAKLPGNLAKLVRGYQQSKKILKEFQPDVLFFTGGYVAIPMALAGRKVKSLLYVPDIEPGLALKTLARFSDQIALTTPLSKKWFSEKKNMTVTGYPLRDDIKKWEKPEARAYFRLEPNLPTILFMGGSSGARSINQAVVGILDRLIEKYQVIHITGHLDWENVQAATANARDHYHAFPYLHEIGAALAAADLAVSRAGASTLGEYPYFGLPAILVPYPYAWRYQKVNADYLVERGAAALLRDEDLKTDLLGLINDLLANPAYLAHMSRAMSALAEPMAAERIAELLFEMTEA
ncbi:MAG: undecaprenyldiphospho-muramoylpentapeptide beta-N-acetylglucosaminyltransferase [Anaerolineaceae bacterium]|nr:undecaprenyldiphospho-muramoylpentapeptide beta-N-acetylglucosaminyltransferase [Anaerolineaceae bacterium]MDD4042409.1 undecaprenyldiphospho-muramoylpentapeptide beta-N-acetylglucosaminyltransferase [Anaerolineaceae bacterium]MDD4578930.1 undecaprenyldiphospho-muramoylpentapeptide beta-N-acetylglucosaminyltransferase [Anaerolineaceae bacterium]